MTDTGHQPRAHVIREGEGLAVVAIHGNGVDHRILHAFDDVLDEVGGLERFYLDLPGFGQTPALDGEGGLPELAEWLVEEIHLLVGGRPFALLANSLGGLLARHIWASFPEEVVGMALIAPVVDPDSDKRTLPELRVVEEDVAFVDSLPEDDREAFTEMAARRTRTAWKMFEEYVLPGIRAVDEDAVERLNERYFLPDPEAGDATFEGPTLVVTGRQDDVVGFEDQFGLLRHYPDATFAVLEGAGHNVHIDQPTLTRDLLRQWARRLPTREA